MRRQLLSLLFTLVLAPALAAQSRSAVVIGGPAAIGFMMESGSIGYRGDLGYNHSSFKSPSSGTTLTGNSYTLGFSLLLFMQPSTDAMRFYVVPRVANNRSQTSSNGTSTTSSTWSFYGGVGVDGKIGARLAPFGETSVGYTSSNGSTAISLGSRLGLAVYLR